MALDLNAQQAMYNNKAAARDKFSDKFSQTINDAIEKAEAQDLALIAK